MSETVRVSLPDGSAREFAAGVTVLEVAEAIGAKDGRIIAASKGLHIYDHCIEIAAQRLNMTNVGTMDDLMAFLIERMPEADETPGVDHPKTLSPTGAR